MPVAIARNPSPHMGRCELTHLAREPIDISLARVQHTDYLTALAELGCRIQRLPDEPGLPDSVFVEDTAVVLDEIALIARPGAATRRAETATMIEALSRYRELSYISSTATLDGGDVLRVRRRLYVGISGRTNAAAVQQMREGLARFGYTIVPVAVRGCLHLKSAATLVGEDLLLVNRHWIEDIDFGSPGILDVDPAEPFAANSLRIGDTLVYPSAYPRTAQRLRDRGIQLREVEVSELAKAEGGVSCCSVIVQTPEG